jgi:hypothetical protein
MEKLWKISLQQLKIARHKSNVFEWWQEREFRWFVKGTLWNSHVCAIIDHHVSWQHFCNFSSWNFKKIPPYGDCGYDGYDGLCVHANIHHGIAIITSSSLGQPIGCTMTNIFVAENFPLDENIAL